MLFTELLNREAHTTSSISHANILISVLVMLELYYFRRRKLEEAGGVTERAALYCALERITLRLI